MIGKICLFSILCICMIYSQVCAKKLPNLLCQARPTVVPTDPLYYPYFVSLHRCNGSRGTTSPVRFRCVASEEENVYVPVRFQRHEKVVVLKNHTKCQTECVIKKNECPYPNKYDPVSCTCSCGYINPPSDIKCGPLKSWSATRCGCVCNKMNRSCENTKKYYFDDKTCSCQCKPNRKRICESRGYTFLEKNCKCYKKPLRQLSEKEINKDKFVGSTTFWIYVLIGEFVVLLFCFDSILYCKKIGCMYQISKSCRKEKRKHLQEADSSSNEAMLDIK
eukprot:gene14097-15569_t